MSEWLTDKAANFVAKRLRNVNKKTKKKLASALNQDITRENDYFTGEQYGNMSQSFVQNTDDCGCGFSSPYQISTKPYNLSSIISTNPYLTSQFPDAQNYNQQVRQSVQSVQRSTSPDYYSTQIYRNFEPTNNHISPQYSYSAIKSPLPYFQQKGNCNCSRPNSTGPYMDNMLPRQQYNLVTPVNYEIKYDEKYENDNFPVHNFHKTPQSFNIKSNSDTNCSDDDIWATKGKSMIHLDSNGDRIYPKHQISQGRQSKQLKGCLKKNTFIEYSVNPGLPIGAKLPSLPNNGHI